MSSLKCTQTRCDTSSLTFLLAMMQSLGLTLKSTSRDERSVLIYIVPNFLCLRDRNHQEMNDFTSIHSNTLTQVEIQIVTFLTPHVTEPTGKEIKKINLLVGVINTDYQGQIRLLLTMAAGGTQPDTQELL